MLSRRLEVKSNEFLTYLSDKLDTLDSRLDDMTTILTIQQEQLKEHMRRSELNETNIELLRAEVKPALQDHLKIKFLLKIIGAVIGAISAVYYFIKIIGA